MTRTRVTELCAETALVVYSAAFLVWYIAAKLTHWVMGAWPGL